VAGGDDTTRPRRQGIFLLVCFLEDALWEKCFAQTAKFRPIWSLWQGLTTNASFNKPDCIDSGNSCHWKINYLSETFRSVTSLFRRLHSMDQNMSTHVKTFLRLTNLQLQSQRCSRLHRFSKWTKTSFLFSKRTRLHSSGVVNSYSAGVATHHRRIGSSVTGKLWKKFCPKLTKRLC
jgi:hypothetical protein